MRTIIVMGIIFLWIVPVRAQEQSAQAQQDSSTNLADVVVQAEYEGTIVEDKIPFHFDPEYNDVVQLPDRIQWYSLQPESETGPENTSSMQLRLPDTQMAAIRVGVVREFQLKFKNLKRWQFIILSEAGKPVRTFSGEGDPPHILTWDGFGDDGSLFIPGQQYNFAFTAVDMAGNKRTFPGNAFSLPAVCLQDSQGVHIGLAHTVLFSPHGFGLLPNAAAFIDEAAMLVRYFSTRGYITVDSAHPLRQDAIDLLREQLPVDDSFIVIRNSSSPCLWIHVQ